MVVDVRNYSAWFVLVNVGFAERSKFEVVSCPDHTSLPAGKGGLAT